MLTAIREGGPFVWTLLVCSVISVTLIFERTFYLRRGRIMPVEILRALEKTNDPSQIGWLRTACEAKPSPLSRLALAALDQMRWPRSEAESAVEVQARQEVVQMERGLGILEVITGIAPLLGLVGTIYGIIPIFGDFGKVMGGDNTFLARGIGLALNKTLVGLLVAIPSLAAWTYFNRKVEALAVELEGACSHFIRTAYRAAEASALPTASAAKVPPSEGRSA